MALTTTGHLTVTLVLYRTPRAPVLAALEALGRQTRPPDDVLVLVNSDDGSAGWLDASHDDGPALPVRVWREAANLGFAGGHNFLLGEAFAAGASLAVVHNPDLVLDATALAELASEARRRPCALLGPVLELADPHTLQGTGLLDTAGVVWTWDGRHLDAHQGEPLARWVPPAPRLVPALSGACLAVPRAAYDRMLGVCGEFFDADYVAYREDAELGLRAGLLGVPSVIVPAARGRHVRGSRGTRRGRDPDVDRLGVRNRFLLAAAYGLRRPGHPVGLLLRDAVVILGVLLRERSSWPGLVSAWRLRHRLREKGLRVSRAAAADGTSSA